MGIDATNFHSIFIIENRNAWNGVNLSLDKEKDLVLCMDFGLFHKLNKENFNVLYLDHLLDTETARKCNSEMNYYLQNWFMGEDKKDLLNYKGYNIGDALLLHVLNDITYFCHFFFNMLIIKKFKYHEIFVISEDAIVAEVLTKLNLSFTKLEITAPTEILPVYNFPIIKWTDDKINKKSLKSILKDSAANLLDSAFYIRDLFLLKKKKTVFIQNYYPTSSIIQTLIDEGKINVILNNYTPKKSILKQKRISFGTYNNGTEAIEVIENFKSAKKINWTYEGFDLGQFLQDQLLSTVEKRVDEGISVIKSIEKYFSKNPIQLMIPVTNLWLENRLIMNYCRNHGIPVFMIINGLLNVKHWRDAHDSNWVNCYSDSLKVDYFKNKSNALSIGDPRMDVYAKADSKIINRDNPVIVIGAAAYNHIDQTSYVAFEFDFLFDVLSVLSKLTAGGKQRHVILKVRANGYADAYQDFVNEYFPDLGVEVIQYSSFIEVVKKADLYLSFYSQTLMEAAALGIPTIYYKKDDADMYKPYDNESELVTAVNCDELELRINDFYKDDIVFRPFLDRKVLEKYIGPLDGNNLQRNLDFIESLLKNDVN